jgi:hypothetical protein
MSFNLSLNCGPYIELKRPWEITRGNKFFVNVRNKLLLSIFAALDKFLKYLWVNVYSKYLNLLPKFTLLLGEEIETIFCIG